MSEYDELLNQNEVFKDTLHKNTLFGPRPSVKIFTIKTQCKLKTSSINNPEHNLVLSLTGLDGSVAHRLLLLRSWHELLLPSLVVDQAVVLLYTVFLIW